MISSGKSQVLERLVSTAPASSSFDPCESSAAGGSESASSLPPTQHSLDAATDLEVLKSVPERFAITDEQTANWLVKKVVAAREYAERVKKWADQEIRRAEREERTLMYLFGRQLEKWAGDEIQKLNGKRKSLALPGGTVGFRTSNTCLQIDDERAVLSWAKENCPTAVTVMEKLSRSVLTEYFEKTGEIPDGGAHVAPAAEKFFIR